jgi:hypothetical protein
VLTAQALVYAFQFKYLPALFSLLLVHLWVEEAADLSVIIL